MYSLIGVAFCVRIDLLLFTGEGRKDEAAEQSHVQHTVPCLQTSHDDSERVPSEGGLTYWAVSRTFGSAELGLIQCRFG